MTAHHNQSLAALLAEAVYSCFGHKSELALPGLNRTRLQLEDEPFTYTHAPALCAVRSSTQGVTAAVHEARDTRVNCSVPLGTPFQEVRACLNRATSALGVTPGTRDAAASVAGLARDSASASSAERPGSWV
jgi:hypothetical protein